MGLRQETDDSVLIGLARRTEGQCDLLPRKARCALCVADERVVEGAVGVVRIHVVPELPAQIVGNHLELRSGGDARVGQCAQ